MLLLKSYEITMNDISNENYFLWAGNLRIDRETLWTLNHDKNIFILLGPITGKQRGNLFGKNFFISIIFNFQKVSLQLSFIEIQSFYFTWNTKNTTVQRNLKNVKFFKQWLEYLRGMISQTVWCLWKRHLSYWNTICGGDSFIFLFDKKEEKINGFFPRMNSLYDP